MVGKTEKWYFMALKKELNMQQVFIKLQNTSNLLPYPATALSLHLVQTFLLH